MLMADPLEDFENNQMCIYLMDGQKFISLSIALTLQGSKTSSHGQQIFMDMCLSWKLLKEVDFHLQNDVVYEFIGRKMGKFLLAEAHD